MNKTYEKITDIIIEGLENNKIAWRKGWANSVVDCNMETGHKYSGINPLVLWASSVKNNFDSSLWGTFKQINNLGGKVKQGSKATPICFMSNVEKPTDNKDEVEIIWFAKMYYVFNLDQTENVTLPKKINDFITRDKTINPNVKADEIVAKYLIKNKVNFNHNGHDRAFFSPGENTISLPLKSDFHSTDEYYATLFHEITHSTGLPLKRFPTTEKLAAFGSTEYSKEELVAEFGASFLCAETGINNNAILQNNTAYIQGWLSKLKNDRTLLVRSASLAQKAVNLVVNGGVK